MKTDDIKSKQGELAIMLYNLELQKKEIEKELLILEGMLRAQASKDEE